MRQLSVFDTLLNEADRALRTLGAPQSLQQRPTPQAVGAAAKSDTSDAVSAPKLTEPERKHAAGLMRVNHAGEVAAQALYFGHAAGLSDLKIAGMMLHAADEEADHLAWCAERLQQLQSRPSILGPIWYGGAYLMGLAAAKISPQAALGFVAETEAQVEAHLSHHERALPQNDRQSLAIVQHMRADEAAHGEAARSAGGIALPMPARWLMGKTADLMRFCAYRI